VNCCRVLLSSSECRLSMISLVVVCREASFFCWATCVGVRVMVVVVVIVAVVLLFVPPPPAVVVDVVVVVVGVGSGLDRGFDVDVTVIL